MVLSSPVEDNFNKQPGQCPPIGSLNAEEPQLGQTVESSVCKGVQGSRALREFFDAIKLHRARGVVDESQDLIGSRSIVQRCP